MADFASFQKKTAASEYTLEGYERLLLDHEQVLKDAFLYENRYFQLFADLLLQRAAAQSTLSCINEEISLYLDAVRQGKIPDEEQIERQIEQIRNEHRQVLQLMQLETEKAAGASLITQEEYRQIHSLFRKNVRLIHPDLHPCLKSDPAAKKLWRRLQNAYQTNCTEAMIDLDRRIGDFRSQHHLENSLVDEFAIRRKIPFLLRKIQTETSREPYLFGEWIHDEHRIEEHRKELEKEIEIFEYSIDKQKILLQEFIDEFVDIQWFDN